MLHTINLLLPFLSQAQMGHGLVVASSPTLSWNLVADFGEIFRYAFMRNAFLAGTLVAIVAGIVGYFVVLRGLSFAGHSLSHVGFAGATAAILVGLSSLYGLLAFTIGSGMIMGWLGKRLQGRDVVTGIVLSWMLGLGVLFLSLYKGYATQAYAVLFGQVLGISQRDVIVTLITTIVTLVVLLAIYRPLLFASLDEEIAEARGVPTQLLSLLFMIVLALAVTAATQVVGVLMIFALLVTPAAIAERLTTRPPLTILCSIILSLLFTWLGLFVSYYLPYPVSFFITTFAFTTYLLVRICPAFLRKQSKEYEGEGEQEDEAVFGACTISASPSFSRPLTNPKETLYH
ncbi:metal ABC transporter permease [Ktedonobacter racemifer]|uniref:ABC-3 protein n=1 Tax=Ktedonobacter racemifer DSM 44963 TaxID=485913 RepID=D6TXW0_KTERA|nr:metal ABC transporter permease [Ktedonobacter racemifer]EFH83157.1 ABC-3 protein [Ktedonobacter racemifer DSM 44963]